MSGSSILNALSVDVEDYFQVTAFDPYVSRDQWDQFESRVVQNTRRILKILDKSQVCGTFFIFGWVAERFPDLVKEIDSAGHEIGSHSYWHRLVYRMTPDEFRHDVRQSKDVLEQIIGRPVTAFRAPTFSITDHSLWALEVLAEEGFAEDSSIFPTRHDRYGIPNAKQTIHRLKSDAGFIWEFPMSVASMIGLSIPASGGGYFRLYPYQLTKTLIRKINRLNRPLMFYIHPWEFDPDQPRISSASRTVKFRHYVNLRTTERKFNMLVRDFEFAPMHRILQEHLNIAAETADGNTKNGCSPIAS